MAPPAGFRDIESSCRSTGFIDLMGVVVDFLAPSPTKGTDWQCTFSVADNASPYEGQRVKVFAPQGSLPQIRGTGDVVILRNFKLKNYRGLILMSNHSSDWIVFPCHAIPRSVSTGKELKIEYTSRNNSKKPTEEQQRYAVELSNLRSRGEWSSLGADAVPAQGPTSSGMGATATIRDKFALIKNVGSHQFYDLIGQVVKMYSLGDRLDVYMTDYTENSLLYNYGGNSEGDEVDTAIYGREGDEFAYLPLLAHHKQHKDWRGPAGRFTIQVTLFHPHSAYAQSKVRVGDYVLLHNVHVKLARDARYSRLEGVMHTDRNHPEKVDVEKVSPDSDGRVKALLRRKKELLAVTSASGNMQDPSRSKVTSANKRSRAMDDETKATKSQKRKRQKEKKADGELPADGNDESNTVESKPDPVVSKPVSAAQMVRLETNQHVACMQPDQPTRALRAVNQVTETHSFTTAAGSTIVLPFQNLLFRAKVRVVDFWPRSIADFAVRTSEFDCLADDSEAVNGDPTSTQRSASPSQSDDDENVAGDGSDDDAPVRKRWTWFFSLLLEDASDGSAKGPDDRLVVHIADDDAVFLLDLDAANLRRRADLLGRLRERLFILWGDLEERQGASGQRAPLGEKSANASNRSSVEKKDERAKAAASKPFECCIKEYGIRTLQGWDRRFRMFGTSIK